MLEKDNSEAMVKAKVEAVKAKVTLDYDNQSTKESGHTSAPYLPAGIKPTKEQAS